MRHIIASTIMLSSMLIPTVAHASSSMDDATVPTPAVRVSTGVTAPSLLGNLAVQFPDGLPQFFATMDGQVGISLTVDESGQPQNVKVVKSSNPYWDARVVDAVQKSHFKPGKVDNTPIPVDMNLTVNIAR
jgi:TonB family protein